MGAAERLLGGPAARAALLALFLAAWELGTRRGWLSTFFVSSPSEVVAVLSRWVAEGRVLGNLLLTLHEAALGYAIGVALGTGLGLLLTFLPRAALVLDPFLVLMNSFPRLTLAPLFIVWFGFGALPKIALVTVFILFICLFNTYRGAQEVEGELLDRARLWGASRWDLLESIYLPATMSWIMTGLRASVGFALVGAVVGEYIGGDAGIGFLIHQGQTRLRMREVLAGLTLLLAIAAVIDAALRRLESRSLAWRPAAARDHGPSV